MRNVPIHIDFKGKHLTGVADPVEQTNEAIPLSYTIYPGSKFIGTLSCEKQGWYWTGPPTWNW